MVPKLIAYRILQPALAMAEPVRLICHEDSQERLLTDLAEHRLDIVLSDAPATSAMPFRVFNHPLGSSGISFFAAPALAKRCRGRFPAILDNAPLLLPIEGSPLRRSLDQWFDSEKVRPLIAGEFQDRALMKMFGHAGAGIFPAPTAIEKEVKSRYQVIVLGRTEAIAERFYVISIERRLKHAAVLTISQAATDQLFA
jgi:LysR family transcriptional activator of nhaA